MSGHFDSYDGHAVPGLVRVHVDPYVNTRGISVDRSGRVQLEVRAQPGESFVIEGSSDLAGWEIVETFVAPALDSTIALDNAGLEDVYVYRVRADGR